MKQGEYKKGIWIPTEKTLPPKKKVKKVSSTSLVLTEEQEIQQLYRAYRIFFLISRAAYRRYQYRRDKQIDIAEKEVEIEGMSDTELIKLAEKLKGINKSSR